MEASDSQGLSSYSRLLKHGIGHHWLHTLFFCLFGYFLKTEPDPPGGNKAIEIPLSHRNTAICNDFLRFFNLHENYCE